MSSELDIMSQLDSVDLSKVETSFPILAGGVAGGQVTACEFRRDTEKKADAKPYLFIEVALSQPWSTQARDGETPRTLQPGDRGMKVVKRIYFGDYEDKKTGEAKKYGFDQMAQFRESAYGKAEAGSKFSSIPTEMLGQSVKFVLKYDPAPKNKDTGETYGPRTEVDRFIKAKA